MTPIFRYFERLWRGGALPTLAIQGAQEGRHIRSLLR